MIRYQLRSGRVEEHFAQIARKDFLKVIGFIQGPDIDYYWPKGRDHGLAIFTIDTYIIGFH